MGTTGGDRQKLEATVRANTDASFAAVIAPNMGKQIVALQAMLEQVWCGVVWYSKSYGVVWDEMRWDGMRWDGMGWDGMGYLS